MNDLIALLVLVVIAGAIGMAIAAAFWGILIVAAIAAALLLPSIIVGFIEGWKESR